MGSKKRPVKNLDKPGKKQSAPKVEESKLTTEETTKYSKTEDKTATEKVKKQKSKKPKSEKEKKEKKKFNSRSLVSMLVLFVLGISSGLFAGDWYVTNFIGGPATDYSLFDEESLRDGNDAIAILFANKIPNKDTAWKSLIAAEKNFYSADSFDVMSNGLVDTIVKQSVYSRKIYDGTTIIVEQISDGMVAVADMFTYVPADYQESDKTTHVKRIKGSLNGKQTIAEMFTCYHNCQHGNKKAYIYKTNYNGKTTTMTEKEYVEAMGGDAISPYSYIIAEKTITKYYNFKVEGSGENTRYTFSVDLHPGAAVLNYVKQMKTVSGLTDYPSFTEVTLNVSLKMLNGKVMFDYICANEKYSVPYGTLTPKCVGTLHQRYLFNEECNFSN